MKASTDPKDSSKLYLDIARYHAALGEYNDAVKNYAVYIKGNPDDEKAMIEYSHSLFWMDRNSEAISNTELLLSRFGRKTELLLEYATILTFSNRPKDAIEVYREILAREPKNLSAHLGLSYIYIKSDTGSPPDNEARLRISRLKDKFSFSIETDIKRTQKISKRLEYESKLLTGISRENIILELAYLKRGVGEYDDSIRYFREYLEERDDRKVTLELARTLNWAKRLPEAVKELRKANERCPQDNEILKELALYESWTGRFKDSQKHFKKALSRDPDNIELKLNLADNQKWAGKREEAFTLYSEVKDKDPQNKRANEGMMATGSEQYLRSLSEEKGLTKAITLNMHGLYMYKKDYDSDIKLLSEFLEKDPNDIDVLSELANSYISSGKEAKALPVLEKTISLNPDNEYASSTLPSLYYWSLDFKKAVKAYEKLESKKELDSTQRFEYAQSLRELGLDKKAAKYYALVLEKDPDNEDARQALIDMNDPSYLEPIFRRSPKDRVATAKLYDAYVSANENAKAEDILKLHIEKDPDDSDSVLKLARTLSWQGKYDESLYYYDKLLNERHIRYKRIVLNESAEMLTWKGDLKKAMIRYNEVLKEDPENIDALTGISKIYLWNGDKLAENETYERILKLDPKNLHALKMTDKLSSDPAYKVPKLEKDLIANPDDEKTSKELLALYQKYEEYDKALPLAKRLAERYPKDPYYSEVLADASQKSTIRKTQSEAKLKEEMAKNPFAKEPKKKYIEFLISSGKNEEAIKEMQSYCMLFPEDEEMRMKLAEVLSWEGRYAEAKNEYETLLLKNPANINHKLALARTLTWESDENYEQALDLANDVIKADPGNSNAYTIRGNIYNWSENYNRALKNYRTAVKYDENNHEARSGIESISRNRYKGEFGMLFRGDNADLKEIRGSLGLGFSIRRVFDMDLSYSHSLLWNGIDPDVNVDRVRFSTGLLLVDPIYVGAFAGFNRYWDIESTVDYGASLRFNLGFKDSLTLGYENTDIYEDSFTMGSVSPNVIDSDYATMDLNLRLTKRTALELFSKAGFYSDTNKAFLSNLYFTWISRDENPLLVIGGFFRFLKVWDKLYATPLYWDPSYYLSFGPSLYLETPIIKDFSFFFNMTVGYGNEESNSSLELYVEPGFILWLSKAWYITASGFYSQTGRSIGMLNYYQYGARCFLYYNF